MITKVVSMDSSNVGKFKNPLRNLNVIFVIVITIFTGLQLMVREDLQLMVRKDWNKITL